MNAKHEVNKKPIESAIDPDLRLSKAALLRAVERAHQIAEKTGTLIVVSENGQVKRVKPNKNIGQTHPG